MIEGLILFGIVATGFFLLGRYTKRCYRYTVCEICQHEIHDAKIVTIGDGAKARNYHLDCWRDSAKLV